jgi:hypothetical protein
MLPAPHDMMEAPAGSLDNLVLAATTNMTTVQQLMLANLSLTTLVATLTTAHKKLTKTMAGYNSVPQKRSCDRECGGDNACRGPKTICGNYCWMHGYKVSHTSKNCNMIGRKMWH